ncbi:MAG TPA: VOC family protein [Alphaproteobacteria bacterium]|nr:VOC family protein [Alphaproteobacteria bacterium]
MKNTFGWMQQGSSDPKKAKEFYGKLFNWSFEEETLESSGATFIQIDAGDGPIAGIHKAAEGEPVCWTPFVNVDDIHKSTAKAEELGAKIIVPITALGGDEGFYSVFIDPTGSVLGLHASK